METAVTEELKQVQSAKGDYLHQQNKHIYRSLITTPWWSCFSLNPTEYTVTYASAISQC